MKNAETFLRAGGLLVITGNEEAPGPKPGQASQVCLTLQPPIIHREKPGHTRHGTNQATGCAVAVVRYGQFRGTGFVLNSGAVWSQEEAPPPLIGNLGSLLALRGGSWRPATGKDIITRDIFLHGSVKVCPRNSAPHPPCGTAQAPLRHCSFRLSQHATQTVSHQIHRLRPH